MFNKKKEFINFFIDRQKDGWKQSLQVDCGRKKGMNKHFLRELEKKGGEKIENGDKLICGKRRSGKEQKNGRGTNRQGQLKRVSFGNCKVKMQR